MSESDAKSPNRLALFSAAAKGALIGIALTLIWPVIRLITGQEASSVMVFLLYFVVLGVTGATAAAFYFSSNGVTRRPAVFAGILSGLLVGLIAGFINTLITPNLGQSEALVYAITILPLTFLGPLAGGLGAWGTSLLPSTMFFQDETPALASRLGVEGNEEEEVEPVAVRDTSLNTIQPEVAETAPMMSEAAAIEPADDLRAGIQEGQSFASDPKISTPWDDGKADASDDSFKPSWEIDTPEESFKADEPAGEPAPDDSYTPAWATSLRTESDAEAPAPEPSTEANALDSRLSDLAPAEDFSSFQDEEAEEPIAPPAPAPEVQPKTKLHEAIALYESGEKEAAQRMLAQIVRNDEPENALAWLWLAATLENDLTKKRFCVQRAITIDPGNQAAQELAADIEATILPPKPL